VFFHTQELELLLELKRHGDAWVGDHCWQKMSGCENDFTIMEKKSEESYTYISKFGISSLMNLLDKKMIEVFCPYDETKNILEELEKANRTGKIENHWRIVSLV
jgi:hypothetical protein